MARSANRKPRYFTDYPGQARRVLMGAFALAAFVFVYSLATFAGLLHP